MRKTLFDNRRSLTTWEIKGIISYLKEKQHTTSQEFVYADKAIYWDQGNNRLSAYIQKKQRTTLYVTWHRDQAEDRTFQLFLSSDTFFNCEVVTLEHVLIHGPEDILALPQEP